MFLCTMVMYEYMKSLRIDVNNLFDNRHVWNKIYQEFYHSIIYIAKERHHVRITFYYHCIVGIFDELINKIC